MANEKGVRDIMTGKDLIDGMKEALEFSKGNTKGSRVRNIRVPGDVDVRAIRLRLEMSQAEFAEAFGFSLPTLRNWEQGRRFPDGPARTLLKVIDSDPNAVETALAI